jgi:LysR family glycine cleavage system transcriptional activator
VRKIHPNIMPQHLPTLVALSAFEAAARHLSFKKAADELCVTPSSVSHQIKSLEEQLGVSLFTRFNRQVALTLDGVNYAAAIAAALADIEHATSAISRNQDARPAKPRLVVSANSGFVDCWLSPRLSDFSRIEPDIELEIHYGEDFADYRHRDADVAIHFNSTGPPGSNAFPLYRAVEFPVCSPDLRIDGKKLADIADLETVTLLHEHDRIGWRRWLQTARALETDASIGPVFQNTQTIFDRVKACEGVGMGDELVAHDDLASGALVKPFSIVRDSDWTLYLIQLRRDRAADAVESFSEWLRQTMNAFSGPAAKFRTSSPSPEDWPN